ncbi:MAG TPA: AarF/UbiB family protein [Polyangia bacterium]|nr:AarF/UbiB family protein [Polyangia bacterium]
MTSGPDGAAILAALIAAVVAAAIVRADRPLALAAETVARFFVSIWVFVRYGAEGARRRLRGEKKLGPELVRRAFEELGPTYLKLAQLIASSSGLFPEAYCREFQKTLDRVRPFAFADVERILRDDLPAPPSELFEAIDPQPLASASIAQVHAATLKDGREVVLKIQRPQIERRVAADVRILRIGAGILSMAPTVELANPIAIIDDFARTIREELDFQLEARNMDEFNRIMEELGHADVRAPRVEHGLTSRRVITMERFRGVRVDDVSEVRARFPGADSEAKLIHGLRAWFQSMILYGFFHGDVHAGNLMVLDDGALGFLDFGIIGRFPPRVRRQITDYIVAFATGDYPSLVKVLLSMDAVAAGVDEEALARDLKKAYAPMLTLSFGDLNYADVLPAIMRNAVKHRMRLPREFVLVTKQMLYFDRYAKLLAPRLNVFSDPRLVAAIGQDVMRARQVNA